jgi:hypothetical protein
MGAGCEGAASHPMGLLRSACRRIRKRRLGPPSRAVVASASCDPTPCLACVVLTLPELEAAIVSHTMAPPYPARLAGVLSRISAMDQEMLR